MRRMGLRIACSMVFFLLTGAGSRRRLGDPEKGEKVFDKCNACHALDRLRAVSVGHCAEDRLEAKSGTT